jgi:hypothetical protein
MFHLHFVATDSWCRTTEMGSTAAAEDEVQSRLLLNVIVREGPTVLELGVAGQEECCDGDQD